MSKLDAPSGLGLSRRDFLQSSGGLVIAFSLPGRAGAMMPAADPTRAFDEPPAGQLYAWLAVHPDNRATLFTGKVDTGTGTQTALAQIAAEELDFPVDRLDVVMGTTSETVDQGPSYGSLAIRMAGPQIRHAAAAGRAVLLDLAAKHFEVSADRLIAHEGVIEVSGGADRRITYGDLVAGRRLNYNIGASGERFEMKVAPHARIKDPR
ncbi:MAG TPA: molybdopterin cofactor-binding domain-containing protein, partial [Steroidobacteraceae bacterium]